MNEAFALATNTLRRRIPALLTFAVCVVGLTHSTAAWSQVTVAGGWVDVGLVTRLHAGDSNPEFLFSTATQAMVTACATNNAGYEFSTNGSNSNRNYATLLSAYSMGKPVAIYLTGGCGMAGRPLVSAVEIHDVPYF